MQRWKEKHYFLNLIPDQVAMVLLQQQVLLDHHATRALVELIQSGRVGYQAGCRIIYHLLKDSDNESFGRGPSRWLVSCVNEANQAIRSWEEWEGPQSSSKGGKGKYNNNELEKGKGKGHEGFSHSSSSAAQPRGFR